MRKFACVVTGHEKRSIKNSSQIPFCKKQNAYFKKEKKKSLGKVFHRTYIYIIAEQQQRKHVISNILLLGP